MEDVNSDNVLVGFIVLGFILGALWALRKVIGHLLLFGIAVLFVGIPLTQPDVSSWWALVGVFIIFGQLGMAKEALFDKPAAEKAAKGLDHEAKKAIIEMNAARKAKATKGGL